MDPAKNSTLTSDSPRDWFQPQFSLLSLFYVISWVAVAAALNLGATTISTDVDMFGHRYYFATRGYPFEYLSHRSNDYGPVPPLDHRGWPVADPMPFATYWLAFAANCAMFALMAVSLWCSLKLTVALASAVDRSRRTVGDPGLRIRLVPALLFVVLGMASAFWAVWFFVWSNRYTLEWILRLSEWPWHHEISNWSILAAGFPGGILAIITGRFWLRRCSVGVIAASCMSVGLLALLVWTTVLDWKMRWP